MVSITVASFLVPVPYCSQGMVPVVVALVMWGARWTSRSVMIHSDNMAVVSAINSGSAKDPLLMHLSHCLHFFLAHFYIRLVACHIAGVCHTAADVPSRNNLDTFHLRYRTCCYFTAQTGSLRAGDACFSVP